MKKTHTFPGKFENSIASAYYSPQVTDLWYATYIHTFERKGNKKRIESIVLFWFNLISFAWSDWSKPIGLSSVYDTHYYRRKNYAILVYNNNNK